MTSITHAIAVAALMTLPAAAQTSPAPAGPVILTVTASSSATEASFDLATLDALPQATTVTHTPWHEGQQTFTGPLFSAVLDAAAVTGETASVVALNDYAADIPLSDLAEIPVILATRQNGEVMSIRDNGPIFVIYPFDDRPELFNEVYFGRSVWQVKAIVVK